MKAENSARIRGSKHSLTGSIRRRVKRFLSVAVSASVIACSMPAVPVMAATDNDVDVQEFTLTVNDLCDAVEKALLEDEPISESAYVFEGDAQEAYDDLFYGTDVYEIGPAFEKDGGNDLRLKIFVRPGDGRELDSAEITGDEEIIFLLLNNSKEEAAARIVIDEYDTGLITVAPRGDIATDEAVTEEISISALTVSDGSGAAENGRGEVIEADADENDAESGEENEAGNTVTAEDEAEREEAADEGSAEASANEDQAEVSGDDDPSVSDRPDDQKEHDTGTSDPADSESQDTGSDKEDAKGEDQEAGKGSGDDDKDTEKPASGDKSDNDDKADGKADSADSGDTKDDDGKADSGDSKGDSGKADNSDSKDNSDKSDSKESTSAKAAKSSRRGNSLRASLDDKDHTGENTDDSSEEVKADDEIVITIEDCDDDTIEDSVVNITAGADDNDTSDHLVTDDSEVVIIEDDYDVEPGEEETTEASVVLLASASNALSVEDGRILLDGEIYEPVVVNHSKSGVGYVTTLRSLGIDYGIQTLALIGDPVYLDGNSGKDENDGAATGASHAVKTFARAKELAEERNTNIIKVSGGITVKSDEEWDGSVEIDNDGTPEKTTLVLYWDNFSNKPMIQVTDGTLTLSNVIIDGNNKSISYAMILVNGDNAEVDIKDGTIIQNHIANYSSNPNTAVAVSNGKVYMFGGEICNNTSSSGTYYIPAGIMIYARKDTTAEFNMSGGSIHDNESLNTGGSYGGGVLLKADAGGKASMKLSDGEIYNNYSAGDGGAIALYMGQQVAYRDGGRVSFEMTGGTIRDNEARYYGGGIYVGTSTTASITGGTISGNKADGSTWAGGGIYINGGQYSNNEDPSMGNVPGELYLYNVEISENESLGSDRASIISCCPTGNIDINITDGAVIHDNEASETRTVYCEEENTSAAFILSPIMLGGAAYHWYDENGNEIDLSDLTVTNESDSRISFSATTDASETIPGSVSGIDRCVTHITGNKSAMAAAIGNNGNLTIGTDDGDVTIHITKKWDTSVAEADRQDVVVEVYAIDGSGEQTYVGRQTLYKDSDWEATINNMPKYDSDGLEYTYTIKERQDSSHNFSAIITGGKVEDEGNSAVYDFTVTNKTMDREFFEIDEEIIRDQDQDESDPDNWDKEELVDEYTGIEFEMSTTLPVLEEDDLNRLADNGSFTMLFHNVFDDELKLEPQESDLHIMVNGISIDPEYYSVDINQNKDEWTPRTLSTPTSNEDGCSFHVTVDLGRLYLDDNGIDASCFTGETPIMIFFYADLEGAEYDEKYESIVWYEVYDNDDQLFESKKDVVWVYTSVSTGDLTISKTVTGGDGDPSQEFTFTLTLSNTSINGTYGDLTFVDGVATFTLKDGETKTAVGLPGGIEYTVTETPVNGYTTTSEAASGRIVAGDTINVTYINDKPSTSSTTGGGTHHGGGGSGGGSRSGGSALHGPGAGEAGPEEEGELWQLLPMPETGEGRVVLFGVCALMLSAMALTVLLRLRRKEI